MRKNLKIKRVNISVPGDTKEKMEQFEKKHPEVNWSAIASKAFSAHIEESTLGYDASLSACAE